MVRTAAAWLKAPAVVWRCRVLPLLSCPVTPTDPSQRAETLRFSIASAKYKSK